MDVELDLDGFGLSVWLEKCLHFKLALVAGWFWMTARMEN